MDADAAYFIPHDCGPNRMKIVIGMYDRNYARLDQLQRIDVRPPLEVVAEQYSSGLSTKTIRQQAIVKYPNARFEDRARDPKTVALMRDDCGFFGCKFSFTSCILETFSTIYRAANGRDHAQPIFAAVRRLRGLQVYATELASAP